MIYASRYKSPIGNILLASDEEGLTGLWFEGQKYFANTLPDERILQETEILREAKKWLDLYFYRRRTPIYATSASSRINIQTGSVAAPIADSLWADDHIWRDCSPDG